jgi:hypothetical protein
VAAKEGESDLAGMDTCSESLKPRNPGRYAEDEAEDDDAGNEAFVDFESVLLDIEDDAVAMFSNWFGSFLFEEEEVESNVERFRVESVP